MFGDLHIILGRNLVGCRWEWEGREAYRNDNYDIKMYLYAEIKIVDLDGALNVEDIVVDILLV